MYVSEQEVRAVLTYQALIPAIRQALIDYSAGRVEQPARTILRAGNADDYRNGWFAVMPVIAGDVMAVKTVTFFPGNDALGLPTHMAVIELLRRATGEPLAVMDGRLITEMRTAAVRSDRHLLSRQRRARPAHAHGGHRVAAPRHRRAARRNGRPPHHRDAHRRCLRRRALCSRLGPGAQPRHSWQRRAGARSH